MYIIHEKKAIQYINCIPVYRNLKSNGFEDIKIYEVRSDRQRFTISVCNYIHFATHAFITFSIDNMIHRRHADIFTVHL